MSTTITASGPLTRWRTIDLLTCAFLGVAFGVAYWAWGLAYEAPSTAVSAALPAAQRPLRLALARGRHRRHARHPPPRRRRLHRAARGRRVGAHRHPVGPHDARLRPRCRASASSSASRSSGMPSTAGPRCSSAASSAAPSRPSTSGTPTGPTGASATRSPTSSCSAGRWRSSAPCSRSGLTKLLANAGALAAFPPGQEAESARPSEPHDATEARRGTGMTQSGVTDAAPRRHGSRRRHACRSARGHGSRSPASRGAPTGGLAPGPRRARPHASRPASACCSPARAGRASPRCCGPWRVCC